MLSTIFTVKKIIDTIRVIIDEIMPGKIQNETIINYINLAIIDICDLLNSIQAPDYGMTATLSTPTYASTGYITTPLIFTPAVIKGSAIATTALTVGERYRIVTLGSQDFTIIGAEYSEIGIEFIATATGTTGTVEKVVSGIDKIIQIYDSINGLLVESKDAEYFNLPNIPQKQKNMFWNWFGQKIRIYKGTGLTRSGSISVDYYRLPVLCTLESDPIDLSDKYITLLLSKVKALVYEQLKVQAPEQLTAQIDSKIQQVKNSELEETASIKAKLTKKGN